MLNRYRSLHCCCWVELELWPFVQAAGKLVSFFKQLGVDYVFDTTFAREFSLLERYTLHMHVPTYKLSRLTLWTVEENLSKGINLQMTNYYLCLRLLVQVQLLLYVYISQLWHKSTNIIIIIMYYIQYWCMRGLTTKCTDVSLVKLLWHSERLLTGWICYAEKVHGSFVLPYISTTKSPQQVMGSLVKEHFAKAINKR